MKRVVLQRRVPSVVCTSMDVGDRTRTIRSCGDLIPYTPNKPCPNCGRKQIRATAPAPSPDSLVINETACIVDADLDEVVAVQILGEQQLASAIAQQLRHVTQWERVGNEGRLSGISVEHNTFGYAAPAPLRSRWACTRCRFDRNYPDAAELIYDFVYTAERRFREHAPDAYRQSAEAVLEAVPNAWLIRGTPWTSGIINNTAALPFHKDSGNIRGSWSAMIACRHGIDGGMLYLADYDVYLAVPHGSISIFDGQSVLHGVTPFTVTSHDAWRYTLVAYAKSGMKSCAPNPADEVERAAIRATDADRRKAERLRK
jgi:hypothetical protein